MTRACDRLILSGTADFEKQAAPRPGGPPLDWIGRRADRPLGLAAAAGAVRPRSGSPWPRSSTSATRASDGRPTRLLTPARPAAHDRPDAARHPHPRGLARHRAARPAEGDPGSLRTAAPRRSGSQLHGARPVRQMPLQVLPPADPSTSVGRAPRPPPEAPAADVPALDARVRGVIAHRLLEDLDFARPAPPPPDTVRAIAAESGAELSDEQVEDIRAIVAAFGASPLCARIAEASSVRREAAFSFPLDPAGGALVTGVVDVLARAPDTSVLVVDYKSDRLGEARAGRGRRARLRHPADRLRARRPAQRRAVRRGRLRLPRAPRRPGQRHVHRSRRPRARRAPHQPRRGCARGPPPGRRGAPPRPLRRLPGPRDAVLVAGGGHPPGTHLAGRLARALALEQAASAARMSSSSVSPSCG